MTDSAADPVDQSPYPSQKHAWITLILLMLGAIISSADRAIPSMLIGPMKAAYHLSDTQVTALSSVAFALFYISMSIPISMLTDRVQRRYVIGLGIGAFSLFSLFSGVAKNYSQLLIARSGVGIGEASLTPAAYSIITDYFPRERLGRAISLFVMANYVGTSLAQMLGGALIGKYNALHAAAPGALFGMEPWQAVILTVGFPGLLLAPCFFLIKEPIRRGLAGKPKPLPLRQVLHELGERRRFLLLIVIGMAMAQVMSGAVGLWTPELFIRVYSWTPAQIGFWNGSIMLVGGILGSVFAGWLVDRGVKRGQIDAPLIVAVISFAVAGIFGVMAPMMPTPELAMLMFVPVLFCKPIAFACIPIALQLILPNRLRGQVSAIYLTVLLLFGMVLGPMIVAWLSDHIFTAKDGIRYAIVAITAGAVPVMILLVSMARGPYRLLAGEVERG